MSFINNSVNLQIFLSSNSMCFFNLNVSPNFERNANLWHIPICSIRWWTACNCTQVSWMGLQSPPSPSWLQWLATINWCGVPRHINLHEKLLMFLRFLWNGQTPRLLFFFCITYTCKHHTCIRREGARESERERERERARERQRERERGKIYINSTNLQITIDTDTTGT